MFYFGYRTHFKPMNNGFHPLCLVHISHTFHYAPIVAS